MARLASRHAAGLARLIGNGLRRSPRGWSTGSTAIMAKFPVLSGIEALTIIADHDLNGAGLRAASEAADRWQTAGRETHVFQRETPGDFNDAFREIER